ncbi:HDOD domain-containing protein [Methylomarinum vadi]|uniref:HDOD domain-containing protein n=1 Tax=Methylomarinum vadi TaxID=438855 RepID=UPI0004DF1238|nr:HDOD domain-containing protein [Methylomarinum vadi]
MTPKILAEKVNSLFSLPDVALRINELLADTKSSNSDLEEVILHDPALTARLLKIVNSSYYGFPSKISTISRAITMLGTKELRNLVMATTVADSFTDIPEHLVDMNTFWYHSVTSAILARLLAKQRNHLDHERFFIAGLLHSIGKLVFFTEYPQQSALILSLKEQGADAMTAKEKETFGFTHTDLGAELLKQWKLPETIWRMVGSQLDPLHAEEGVEDACILHVAAVIADRIEPCAKQDLDFQEPELDYASPVFKYLQVREQDIQPLIQEAVFQAFDILSYIRPEASVIF